MQHVLIIHASVNVKWGKEKMSDVECNTDEPPMLFKSTLFSLTGVVPERMKVMVKGAAVQVIKHTAVWGTELTKS